YMCMFIVTNSDRYKYFSHEWSTDVCTSDIDVGYLIPFGNETPWRSKALEYTKTWYEERLEGSPIHVGIHTGTWSKAQAVAQALSRSREPVIVIADADCVTPGLQDAVHAVRQGAAWAVPHL